MKGVEVTPILQPSCFHTLNAGPGRACFEALYQFSQLSSFALRLHPDRFPSGQIRNTPGQIQVRSLLDSKRPEEYPLNTAIDSYPHRGQVIAIHYLIENRGKYWQPVSKIPRR